MGIRINTNVSSLNTQRHLQNTTTQFTKSMEKLILQAARLGLDSIYLDMGGGFGNP